MRTVVPSPPPLAEVVAPADAADITAAAAADAGVAATVVAEAAGGCVDAGGERRGRAPAARVENPRAGTRIPFG